MHEMNACVFGLRAGLGWVGRWLVVGCWVEWKEGRWVGDLVGCLVAWLLGWLVVGVGVVLECLFVWLVGWLMLGYLIDGWLVI